MSSRLPIVLIHGYSDHGKSFQRWTTLLRDRGYDPTLIHIADYQTLTNEITIKDLAEGLDRALHDEARLKDEQPFDAIVHSTGMLVIRSWLVTYAHRRQRLKHLIGLAPATFGSPLAHKGRSWLGAIFKGNKTPGPDFMEAGNGVLDGLELASAFTWDLAHRDLIGDTTFYGPTKRTPYPFVFCGTNDYGGLRRLINEDGTDGTVRWAGCSLDTRKITLDFTRDPDIKTDRDRLQLGHAENLETMPVTLMPGLNHTTILSDPSPGLVDLVTRALEVESLADFEVWRRRAAKVHMKTAGEVDQWQQFVVRALDERGDPITDYNVQLFSVEQGKKTRVHRNFAIDVHAYREDSSLRCFHVKISDRDLQELPNLWAQVIASTGSTWVGYRSVHPDPLGQAETDEERGMVQIQLDLSRMIRKASPIKFFYPFTTTLIELRLDREPLPLTRPNKLFRFVPGSLS